MFHIWLLLMLALKPLEVELEFKEHNYMFNSYEMELNCFFLAILKVLNNLQGASRE
jgi:hypothetical protein